MDTKIFVQCRLGSKRLPRKILYPFQSSTILGYLIDQLTTHFGMDHIVLVMPDNPIDDELEQFAIAKNLNYFRGSEDNVFERFQKASQQFPSEYIVRLTADNPLIDMSLIKKYIEFHSEHKPCLTSSRTWKNNKISKRFLPKGCSIDVIKAEALRGINSDDLSVAEKEHIIPFFWKQKLSILNPSFTTNHKFVSVDTLEEYNNLLRVCK